MNSNLDAHWHTSYSTVVNVPVAWCLTCSAKEGGDVYITREPIMVATGEAADIPASYMTLCEVTQQVFIEKWGQEMWDEMETGQLWLRLHRENP